MVGVGWRNLEQLCLIFGRNANVDKGVYKRVPHGARTYLEVGSDHAA